MSVVAINAGSIKIKNIETYGTNEKFNMNQIFLLPEIWM